MVKGVNLTLYEFYHDKKKIEKKIYRRVLASS